ncbi:MAG: tetratricopeptide repeat protein [Melioribacteraceae bacterium]|nr:tetratricopeptide repeat protein [Melioribacteraceae bacterium]
MQKLIYILLVIITAGCATNKIVDVSSEADKKKEEQNEKLAVTNFINGSVYDLKGEYADAILEYQEALRLDPSAGIYFVLGKNYLFLNKIVPALRNTKQAVALDSTNVDYNILLAEVFSKAHLVDSAQITYQKILELDSLNVHAYFNLAQISEKEKPIKALELYNKILDITGPEWNILIKVADLNERMGNVEATINTVEELVEFNPSNYEIRKLLIESYIKTQKNEKALDLINDVQATYPDDLALKEYKAQVHLNYGEWHKGADLYLQIIDNKEIPFKSKVRVGVIFLNQTSNDTTLIPVAQKIFSTIDADSSDWQVKVYLAELALAEKNDSVAIDYFKEAAKLSEWNSMIWMRLGGLLFDNGRLDEAIVEMKKAVANYPDEFVINVVLGLSYAQLQYSDSAKPFLEKSVILNPEDFTSRMAYGFVLQQLDEQDKALIHLNKALSLNPKSVQVLGTLGMIYDDKEDWKNCFKYYEQAIQLDSNDATILNNYAYSLSKNDIELEKSLRMVQKAVDLEPENSSYLDTIGWVYFKLGDYENAKLYIEKSLEITRSAVVIEHLGDVYFKCGDKKAAMNYWEEAGLLDPENETIKAKIEKGGL